jgi:hypothetical protein
LLRSTPCLRSYWILFVTWVKFPYFLFSFFCHRDAFSGKPVRYFTMVSCICLTCHSLIGKRLIFCVRISYFVRHIYNYITNIFNLACRRFMFVGFERVNSFLSNTMFTSRHQVSQSLLDNLNSFFCKQYCRFKTPVCTIWCAWVMRRGNPFFYNCSGERTNKG